MKRFYAFLVLATASLSATAADKTYVQRCMSGSDMEAMIDRVSCDTFGRGSPRSLRATAVIGATSNVMRCEYFQDEACSIPHLTKEETYLDVMVGDQLSHHRFVNSKITCHSDSAKEDIGRLAHYLRDSPIVSWDGTVYTENLSALNESYLNVRFGQRQGSTASRVLFVIRPMGGGLIPFISELENEHFVLQAQ